jgi:hypothetical protein
MKPIVDERAPSEATAATAAPTARSDLERLLEIAGEQWYGVYMLGKKVGHARTWLRASSPGEEGALATGTEVSIRVKGPSGEVDMAMEELRYYGRDAPHPLVHTRRITNASGSRDERAATASASGLTVTRLVDGKRDAPRTLPATRETLTAILAAAPLEVSSLRAGQVLQAAVFSWDLERDDEMEAKVNAVHRTTRAGIQVSVAELEVTHKGLGLTGTSRIAEPGVMLEMTVGMGLVMRLEEREVARSSVEGLDVLGSGVDVAQPLGPPGAIRDLSLRVRVPDGYRLPTDARQTVETKDGQTVLRVSAGGTTPVAPEDRLTALAADATMDSESPLVRETARQIVAGSTGDRDQAERLRTWVYRHLDKRLATHLPNASTVLAKRVGDCTEHAWLMVALARAAGIPARPVYGIAYIGDEHRRFGYHAWVELAIADRWVTVDPTWDQAEADATHIKLAETLPGIAAAMGGLTLEVLEVKRQ